MSMITAARVGSAVLLASLLACASARVVEREDGRGDLSARPSRILVYDFAVSPEQVKLDRAIGERLLRAVKETSVSEEQTALGAQVADALAGELVQGLLDLGLPAERADDDTRMGGTLLAIEGQFVTLDEGNRTRRLAIGFGVGASEVRTEAQLYAIERGYRKLARQFSTEASGTKLPGATTPLGVGAAGGSLARGAAIAAGKSVASEALAESLSAGAKRTARQIVREVALFHADRGWLPREKVPSESRLP